MHLAQVMVLLWTTFFYAVSNLLAKIFDFLLRLRLNYIGILAHIKHAFPNVKIFADHQKFLRFLWLDTNDPSLDSFSIFGSIFWYN